MEIPLVSFNIWLQEDRGLGLEGVRFAAPSSRWRCGTGKMRVQASFQYF